MMTRRRTVTVTVTVGPRAGAARRGRLRIISDQPGSPGPPGQGQAARGQGIRLVNMP